MLRVLIIGAGNIAGGFDAQRQADALPFSHAGAYTRHGGFELVACVEPDVERCGAFMKRWGVGQGYVATSDLPADIRFDVISICSPTSTHAADLRFAIACKPRLIFCEKPLTTTSHDSSTLIKDCEAAGIYLAVNYTRRWDAEVRRLAGDLQAGRWGAVRSASATYNKGLLNNGSHMIDLLRFLLGPLHVIAVGQPVVDMWPEDPSIPALLRSENGTPITLNCGHAGDYALFELQLVTERGLLAMEDGGLQWRVREPENNLTFSGYRTLTAGHREQGSLARATLAAVTEIHAALTDGGPLSSVGKNALAAQQVCETIAALATRHTGHTS